ncbi:MAG: ribosome biogenesis GTPase Der [Gammaproteobacteria bacterium]
MLPVIALVGRPNVGKSTLFNALTRTRDAIVADQPGLTRDRQYGFGVVGPHPYLVVDTGGLSGDEDGLDGLMAKQTQAAIAEADAILFIVDGREGLTASDQQIAQMLRRQEQPTYLIVNKTEGFEPAVVTAEFHQLGSGQPLAVSAAHGHNVGSLMDEVFEALPPPEGETAEHKGIKVAIVGRPNVGKSTLVNRLVGEERVVAFDQPGTTRDSVFVPFERDGVDYTLIDTAGVRRRARVHDGIEKFSVIKALKAVDSADVVIAMLDASEGVTEQDVTLLGLVLHRGRAVTIALNKWDGLDRDQRDTVRRELEVKLPFLNFARWHFISALHGSGIVDVLKSVRECHRSAYADLPTPVLTEMLEDAVRAHPPPVKGGRRPKLRYAHQGGRNPQTVVIHGSATERVPEAWRRYFMGRVRKAFRLTGAPIRLQFKSGKNPYKDKKNKLTPRQQKSRKRMIRHVKKK